MNDKIFEGYRGSTPPYLDITQLRIKPLLEKKWSITQRRGKRNWCIRKVKRDCQNLLSMGMSVKDIIKATDLKESDILNLQNKE